MRNPVQFTKFEIKKHDELMHDKNRKKNKNKPRSRPTQLCILRGRDLMCF